MLILEEKLPDKKCFYSSVKAGTTNDDGEKLDGHMSDKDYLTCNKILNELNMKNMGDYHNHYQKKDVLLLAEVFEKFIDTCIHRSLGLFWFSWIELRWDIKNDWFKIRKKIRHQHVLIH